MGRRRAAEAQPTPRSVSVRRLEGRDREAALAHLARDPRGNLLLLDMVRQVGAAPPPGEERVELLGAFRGGALVGVAAVRPSIVFDSGYGLDALEASLPYVARLAAGLVKSDVRLVERVWARLAARGLHALVDRTEYSCAVEPARLRAAPARDLQPRPAEPRDLEALVHAARASLREEGRPDPYDGDPSGFRRWVRGRIGRARVIEVDGRIAFVGYADVQHREGWLLQGVYTWPEWRRRGHAAAGVSDLCRLAFASGASHVQLSVVEGNTAARRLYERLGFEPFACLRTILFS